MKFVKRISLFFIYPLSMFSLGFASNMAIMEYFYPGEQEGNVPKQEELAAVIENQPKIEVSVSEEPVVTANTQYILQEYNVSSEQLEETEVSAPDKYIGLDREKLVEEIESYNQNPSLTDLEKIVVRKSYEPEEDQGFFLLNENHYVVVYNQKLTEVYMDTDILVEDLPQKLQEEIINMKFVEDEGELYNFLESYSS